MGQALTFCTSFGDTLATGQSKLHPEGSRGSYWWRWRNSVDLNNQSFHRSTRVPTLEEKPGQQTVSLEHLSEYNIYTKSDHSLKMAVPCDGTKWSNPHFIRGGHSVLIHHISIVLLQTVTLLASSRWEAMQNKTRSSYSPSCPCHRRSQGTGI